ncbi:hypothetical protein M413DRAFT_284982 [Hebeloma cylindrosporum]|uniref:Uncharacterized protein n=1 Tax=Hebeloma cylindrosporum TaxID=76867 RepID=A0A0C3BJB1_HEBCY|nr:hypothetical protein M413DRAFT_284982 [Hebeloma cylindrosporum h7]
MGQRRCPWTLLVPTSIKIPTAMKTGNTLGQISGCFFLPFFAAGPVLAATETYSEMFCEEVYQSNVRAVRAIRVGLGSADLGQQVGWTCATLPQRELGPFGQVFDFRFELRKG